VRQKFILHWGEMGARWGINRTVAQIHALLYLAPAPLDAEEIAETLDIARSNVSTSLKELQSWRIVRRVHIMGDKRDHFESMKDVWEMFRLVLDERKRREIDPTLAMLEACMQEAAKNPEPDKHIVERLRELRDFFQQTTGWYARITKLPAGALRKFIGAGDRALKALGLGG
jgi:DNA-binding transcriptional regulator GbsR (MarR family)